MVYFLFFFQSFPEQVPQAVFVSLRFTDALLNITREIPGPGHLAQSKDSVGAKLCEQGVVPHNCFGADAPDGVYANS